MKRRDFLNSVATSAIVGLSTAEITARATENQNTGPENQNGILLFKNGQKPSIPDGLTDDFEVLSRFGFKVVKVKDANGKEKQMWAVATERDFRKAESIRRKIKPEEVNVGKDNDADYDSCMQIGPTTCNNGFCLQGLTDCIRAYYPAGQYYYCICA